MRIASIDPGKQHDSMALVFTELEKDVIHVRACKRWLGKKYLKVQKEIADIHERFDFDYIALERNGVGEPIVEGLADLGLPIVPIYTTANLKDPAKMTSSKLMDKNSMAVLMMQLFEEDRIVFPAKSTRDIDELKRQLSIFSEHKTDAGNVSYRAQGSEHDDLVMALMLNVFVCRHLFERTNKMKAYSSDSHNQALEEWEEESGIPPYAYSLGKSVIYPN